MQVSVICDSSEAEEVTHNGDTYADPWVLEGLLSSDPLGWVDGQHLVDKVLSLWGDCVPLWRRELQRQTELNDQRRAGTFS